MAKVTNVSGGPRGIWSTDGLVMLNSNETANVDLADGEEEGEWFSFDGSKVEVTKTVDLGAALKQLDADDDTHWTAGGLPSVEAVQGLTGEKVTRAQIEAASPDFNRETARG